MQHSLKNEDHGFLVRGLLLQRGYSLRKVARELGVAAATISFVVRLERRSLRVETRIIEIIGAGGTALFPPAQFRRTLKKDNQPLSPGSQSLERVS